ncbi:DNA helicase [Sporosarcina sp. GW1-11]|uniref:replicative DNA helicase n=1 Tax=Sporosarcina sp. GW1-11 TaxID=2899126 RepID=UPI00294DDA7D|nr:DnaB-like helicase C-terminal domain-containing protein [Sporosarcina sp. GW1-11]MDV6379253.1 DNA helicase [Sporosarcina sp. GW1-11]
MKSELAEKSVLGTMLQENYLILDSGMKEWFFQTQVHKTIYASMCELARKGKSVDYITLIVAREPAELGGANYLAELTRLANPTRFDEYKEIVIDTWKKQEKSRLLHLALHNDWTIAQIQKAFDTLEDNDTLTPQTSIKPDLIAQYERPFIKQEEMTGITTGLRDLDYILNGFQKSEFIVVAARPSMGKTDMLNHFALTAGLHGHVPIVFSLEMSRTSITDRLIACAGNYSRLKMRDPNKYFTKTQKANWTSALKHVNLANIHIDDRSGLKVSQMKATARKIIKSNPDKRPIIFIDYLQIIRAEQHAGNQTQAIGQISADLKTMAKEFNCPVVVLSQLSRAVEQRQDKHPIMSDLRDSGNIEQDADVVCFLYRDDYYDKESDAADHLEIHVAKHRNGPIGRLAVYYSKDTGQLRDIQYATDK